MISFFNLKIENIKKSKRRKIIVYNAYVVINNMKFL